MTISSRLPVLLMSAALLACAADTPAGTPAGIASKSLSILARSPQLLSRSPLNRPEIARQANAIGPVRVEVRIGADGRVLEARAISGQFLLRPYAEKAIREWRYAPAETGGSHVEATTYVTLNFRSAE